MEYRTLGRTGIKVSQVGLGCEHLQDKPYEVVESIIHRALDLGINVFDVFMPQPQIRTDLGKAFAGRREQAVLQGHIGAVWENGQYKRSRDISKCRAFFQDFLERLQTDYVDIGMIHYVDDEKDFQQVFNGPVMEYAKELKEKKVIRAIGMSSHNPVTALRAVKTGLIDVLMFSVNPAYDLLPEDTLCDDLFQKKTFENPELLGVNPIRAELYRTCEAMGVGITVMKGLGAGMLLNPKSSPFGFALTPGQCIRYSLTRPAVCSVLAGAVSVDELEQNAGYFALSDEQVDFAKVLSSAPKFSMKGKCMYCNHCLPCPAHIDIAQVNKFLDLALMEEKAPETIREHYRALSAHGGDCLTCGSCEKNCPFGVEVIKRMARAKEIFGC